MSTHWNKFLLPHNSYLIYSMDCIKNLQFEQNNKSHDKWNLSFFQKDLHIKLHLYIRYTMMYLDVLRRQRNYINSENRTSEEGTWYNNNNPRRFLVQYILVQFSWTIYFNGHIIQYSPEITSMLMNNIIFILKFCLEWWLCY